MSDLKYPSSGLFCNFYIFAKILQHVDSIVNLKILADAMGLGKTIMTISLLLAHSGTGGGSSSTQLMDQPFSESGEAHSTVQNSSNVPKKATKFSGFDKLRMKKNTLTNGGSLIICPMTLLGQWKVIRN